MGWFWRRKEVKALQPSRVAEPKRWFKITSRKILKKLLSLKHREDNGDADKQKALICFGPSASARIEGVSHVVQSSKDGSEMDASDPPTRSSSQDCSSFQENAATSVVKSAPIPIKGALPDGVVSSKEDEFEMASSILPDPTSSPDEFEAPLSAFPPCSPMTPRASDDGAHPDYSPSASNAKFRQEQLPNEVDSGYLTSDFQTPDSSFKNSKLAELANTRTVETSVEVLVRIPGSMVHLIDAEESELLATGEFTLAKIVQNGNAIALFARVGNNFQWPIVKNEATVKLDASHYFFSLRIPSKGEKKGGNVLPEDERLPFRGFHRASIAFTDSEQPLPFPFQSPNCKLAAETMSYGVTFTFEENDEKFRLLDKLLDQYSFFSKPTVVPEVPKDADDRDAPELTEIAKEEEERMLSHEQPTSNRSLDAITLNNEEDEKKQSEEISTEYWTTLAPNVQQYNSILARAIAHGSAQIIRGIFWCSDTTAFQLERGGSFMTHRLRQNSKLTQISPRTMANIRRANRISAMSEKVAKAVLSGVVMSTEFFTSFMLQSKTSRKFVKLLPGEVALVSLDAYAKIFEALEVAGNNVLTKSSLVTSGIVSHRYGPQAAEFTQEGLAAAGHVFGTVWTVSQIRNAFGPRSTANGPKMVKNIVARAAQGGDRRYPLLLRS